MLEKMSWTSLPWRRKWEEQKAVPHLCFTQVVSALSVLESTSGWFCDSTAALSHQKQNQPEPGAALQHWKLDLVPVPWVFAFPDDCVGLDENWSVAKRVTVIPLLPRPALHAVPGLLDGRMVHLISDCAIPDDDLWKKYPATLPFTCLSCGIGPDPIQWCHWMAVIIQFAQLPGNGCAVFPGSFLLG